MVEFLLEDNDIWSTFVFVFVISISWRMRLEPYDAQYTVVCQLGGAILIKFAFE